MMQSADVLTPFSLARTRRRRRSLAFRRLRAVLSHAFTSVSVHVRRFGVGAYLLAETILE